MESLQSYQLYQKNKRMLLILLVLSLVGIFLLSLSLGAVKIPLFEVVQTIIGQTVSNQWNTIIWNIRLPQALTAIVAGVGLSLCGVVMQSILKNPLASPFTLGISHASAFGAALSVMFLGAGKIQNSSSALITIVNPYLTTIMAFLLSLLATITIMIVTKIKRGVPEVIVLTGVALGSLFTAGTAFLQYFADDNELSSIIFWSFGDVARASWYELLFISLIVFGALIYFFCNRWNYNAMASGDETAKGVGVSVERVRIISMVLSSLVTAVIISFLGVIGFVGLVAPHMARRIIGDDHRFLILFGSLLGALLLLSADTVGRIIIAPHLMPVAVITSFMGAPIFIYLLLGEKK